MPYLMKVLLIGALGVVAYDAAASVASRQLGFAYTSASVGSWLLYATVGYFAVRSGGGVSTAALAVAVMGLVDATVGWGISWAIGPGRLPEGTLTPGRWLLSAVVVMLTGAAMGALGGVAARIGSPASTTSNPVA